MYAKRISNPLDVLGGIHDGEDNEPSVEDERDEGNEGAFEKKASWARKNPQAVHGTDVCVRGMLKLNRRPSRMHDSQAGQARIRIH